MYMNPNINMEIRARVFPVSDALCLSFSVSKNWQGALHWCPGAMQNRQGFLRFSRQERLKNLAQNCSTWNIGSLIGKTM